MLPLRNPAAIEGLAESPSDRALRRPIGEARDTSTGVECPTRTWWAAASPIVTVAASSGGIRGHNDSTGGVCVVTEKRPKPADLKRLALGQRFGWKPGAALVGRPLDLASAREPRAQPQDAVAPPSPRVPPARRKPIAELQVIVVSRGTAPLLNVKEAAAALRVSPVMLSDWLLDAPVVDLEALKAWRAAWAPRPSGGVRNSVASVGI